VPEPLLHHPAGVERRRGGAVGRALLLLLPLLRLLLLFLLPLPLLLLLPPLWSILCLLLLLLLLLCSRRLARVVAMYLVMVRPVWSRFAMLDGMGCFLISSSAVHFLQHRCSLL
jgi:hypothetical protein